MKTKIWGDPWGFDGRDVPRKKFEEGSPVQISKRSPLSYCRRLCPVVLLPSDNSLRRNMNAASRVLNANTNPLPRPSHDARIVWDRLFYWRSHRAILGTLNHEIHRFRDMLDGIR